jgi:hypothetical protein
MKVSNYFLIVLTAAIFYTNSSWAATFNVTNNNDSGAGSLRQAILNANSTPGQDRIEFPNATYYIQITSSQFPALTDNAGVIIDGYSPAGTGSWPNSNPQGQPSNAYLKVVIWTTLNIDGIYISTWNNTISGLVINGFYRGIVIDGAIDGACKNYIIGCYIGTDYTGNVAVPNFIGISVINGAGDSQNRNYIGDGTDGGRNLISGNNNYGIELNGSGTEFNQILGNYIGTEKNGISALGNFASGVRIENGASYNTVGGLCVLPVVCNRNIISGNGANIYDEIDIKGPGTSNNTVSDNFIGTDCTGSYAIPNGQYGVCISNGASNNTIAGMFLRLVISGNNAGGVWIEGINTSINTIDYAYIGLNAAGTSAIPNNGHGVYVNNGASFNNIGMTYGGALSIYGNLGDGIRIEGEGTNYNLIRGAWIGAPGMGNGGNGIHILNWAQYNQIGGNHMETTMISYNALHGILIDNAQYNSVINTGPIFNQITNNAGNGITVMNAASVGNKFSGNTINNNGGLGIDLNNDGVTNNDPGDNDSGPNDLLNYPVISSACVYQSGGGNILVLSGTVDIGPNPELAQVEVYLATPPDPSGHGEALYITSGATPDPAGYWSAQSTYPPNPGDFINAVTIDQNGNTSEFSQNFMVTAGPLQFDFGDAPDGPYPTLISSNGAGHAIVTGAPWLGDYPDFPDAETDGLIFMQPLALGDDFSYSDDEDGVTFITPLYAGLQATISFEVQNGPAWVDAWIDFNGNGIWGDMGGAEYIISGLFASGITVVPFIVPAGSVNQTTYIRFRINSIGPLSPTGIANDGEVEDYDQPVYALWVGGTPGAETDWSNPNNWSNGFVPTNFDDLVIPGGLTYTPVISGNANCDDIFILDGGILTLNAGANLVASGNMTIGQGISGQLIVNAGFGQVIGTTFINPAGAIHIYGGTFTP